MRVMEKDIATGQSCVKAYFMVALYKKRRYIGYMGYGMTLKSLRLARLISICTQFNQIMHDVQNTTCGNELLHLHILK